MKPNTEMLAYPDNSSHVPLQLNGELDIPVRVFLAETDAGERQADLLDS
jgi:hypothetical protein